MLRNQSSVGRVQITVTDRHDGVSAEPFRSFNLGGHVGDRPQRVTENRHRLAAALGFPTGRVLYLNQVHGADVAVADGPWSGPAPDADAVVTTEAGLALAILVADCVPVLLADPDAGVIGAAHAGRPGLVAGVVPAVVAAMRALGAHAIRAEVGPSVCGLCYEVPAAMRAEVAAVAPAAWATTRRGTAAVDVAAGVLEQLAAAGVPATRMPGCTVEDGGLYSYRRDRTTGRFAGLIWLAETAA